MVVVNFLAGTGVIGSAFFMSDNFTEPICDVLAGVVTRGVDHLETPLLSELLTGGRVAMGGATCLEDENGTVPPMLALCLLRTKGLCCCLLAARISLEPKQVEMGRAARGLGAALRFSCERDLAALSAALNDRRWTTSRLIGGATVTP